MATFTKSLLGYRVIATRAGGDSLQQVAARELGDAARWVDLAALNNLVPPYLTTDLAGVAPGVLFCGEQLKVPSAAPGQSSGVSVGNEVLGTDLVLVNGAFTPTASGDLATVSGGDNLTQAISHRLATHMGELVFYPTYGCEIFTLLGEAATPSNAQLAAAFADRAILGDSRVARTQDLQASLVGDQVSVSGTAISVDGKTVFITNT